MNRAQTKMRDIIVEDCYEHAGEDPIMSDACDLFESDAITLLWNSLDYTDMMEFNKHKYTFIYEKMPEHMFDHMMERFKPIKHTLDELLGEVDEHKLVVLAHIKEDVEKRTKGIMIFHDQFPNNPDHPAPKIAMYKLEVKQTIPTKRIKPIELHIPRPLRMDGSTDLFDIKPDDGFAYSGNGKDKKKISVEKKRNSLYQDHHYQTTKDDWATEEEEPEPIKAKVIKDYGEEAENIVLPGEEPKDFMTEFMKSNNDKEYDQAMQMATFAHQTVPHDIPNHYYTENPESHGAYKRRLRLRKHYKPRHVIKRHWPNLV